MKKKTDNPNVTINITLFSNIHLDGKSLICTIITIFSIALVISICDPTVRAEIVRLLISMASDC